MYKAEILAINFVVSLFQYKHIYQYTKVYENLYPFLNVNTVISERAPTRTGGPQ